MSGTTEPNRASKRPAQRRIRIAAVGDLHYDGAGGHLRDLFAEIGRSADILALCGDMTTHGRPEQMRGFVQELAGVEIPIVAVLGNHDCEADQGPELAAILGDRGVHVLDGGYTVIDGIGFAGTKGFAGGFGRGTLAPFGEKLIKDFVQAAIDEAIKIENALRNLRTPTKVVLLHYAPIPETCAGEPETIYPFLGSSRMIQPLDAYDATVIFHGHAHHGSLSGATPGGVPVYNVSRPLLSEHGHQFMIWSTDAPERRGEPPEHKEPRPHARVVAEHRKQRTARAPRSGGDTGGRDS